MTNDGFHTYTYDAEGNIMTVDGGSTASYIYDALNHRGRSIVGGEPTEFVYNVAGQRATTYVGFAGTVTGQYYWGGKRVAFYKGGSLHFQHQDWLGTERTRTTYNGAVEGTFTSLPFGDDLTTTGGTDTDAYHFAQIDHDYESDTEHAQFRQYSSAQGRFLSPDPYGGSYDPSNPQSFNRYAYALNNPLSNIDPSGQECVWDDGSYDSAGDPDTGTAGGCGAAGGTFIDPAFFESVQGNQPGSWSGQASSSTAFSWLTTSATVFGGPNAAQQEVADVVAGFLVGNEPPNINYLPQDPFTVAFQKSAGMDAINAKIAGNCPATSGKIAVGTPEAFMNTLIDGVVGEQGFLTPEAQLGAFNATYSSDGGTTSVTVTNPISLNSLALHRTAPLGIQNPASGPLSTINQTLQIQEPDPCY